MQLPFEDASFDAATMGYGLRNVADIPAALRVSADRSAVPPGCPPTCLPTRPPACCV
jgi:demethylmenaquinone methyltransferase/2-methoxy-6-polyprenyl-1,4-benzoquinol methylase